MPVGAVLDARLDAVLLTLYLLFNEGYYSASPSTVLRRDLCVEAMRLCFLLTEHKGAKVAATGAGDARRGVETGGKSAGGGAGGAGRSDVYSLLALMCFQASRFDARMNDAGDLVLYDQQDPSRWDQELIDRGNYFFVVAYDKGLLSRYHFEAAIAWWHTQPKESPEKWPTILQLYNRLLVLHYSPIAALNRAYAYARVYGKAQAIPEAEGLALEGNLFYHSLLGELYTGVDTPKAVLHFEKALALAGTDAEKAVIAEKLAASQIPQEGSR